MMAGFMSVLLMAVGVEAIIKSSIEEKRKKQADKDKNDSNQDASQNSQK